MNPSTHGAGRTLVEFVAPFLFALPGFLFAASASGEPPRTITEFAKITCSAGFPVAFGASVAVSGDDLVVGAPGYLNEAGVIGAAYVFRRSGPHWVETARLLAGFDPIDGEDFGLSVAIDGDLIVVGAPHNIAGVIGGGFGRAFIYRRHDPGTPDDPYDDGWHFDAMLTSPDEIRGGDVFGTSVSVSEGVVLIGRPGWDYSSGSAYLYRYVSNVWVHHASLNPSDTTIGDRFGRAVSVDGTLALVGAFMRDDAGPNSGAAYIFSQVGGVWGEERKLTPSDAASFDAFGNSVSLAGNCAVVGAYGNNEPATHSGSSYAYSKSAIGWNDEKKLVASDASDLDSFGQAVAADGVTIVVGSPEKELHVGAAYLFSRSGDQWVEERKLLTANRPSTWDLGKSVAVSAGYAFVGAAETIYVYVIPSAARSLRDFAAFQRCFTAGEGAYPAQCDEFDLVPDDWIDLRDFDEFRAVFAGP